MIVLPESVGTELGLGELFQAVPFKLSVHQLDVLTTDGTTRLYVLKFATPSGATGYVCDPAALATVRDQLVQASTGLIIATNNERL